MELNLALTCQILSSIDWPQQVPWFNPMHPTMREMRGLAKSLSKIFKLSPHPIIIIIVVVVIIIIVVVVVIIIIIIIIINSLQAILRPIDSIDPNFTKCYWALQVWRLCPARLRWRSAADHRQSHPSLVDLHCLEGSPSSCKKRQVANGHGGIVVGVANSIQHWQSMNRVYII